ncbi:hypothetical protein BOX15_Mlig021226g1 [Macrostomum lignano]|uniref:Uncharacterized protein n=1 Tax=Macrostomum lignano TaxID=282301 RepID=A0A267G6Y9_9PLAT|nr:hypothetical protein BOX15_Mlig021226g1 [Macrostomum lignano]
MLKIALVTALLPLMAVCLPASEKVMPPSAYQMIQCIIFNRNCPYDLFNPLLHDPRAPEECNCDAAALNCQVNCSAAYLIRYLDPTGGENDPNSPAYYVKRALKNCQGSLQSCLNSLDDGFKFGFLKLAESAGFTDLPKACRCSLQLEQCAAECFQYIAGVMGHGKQRKPYPYI